MRRAVRSNDQLVPESKISDDLAVTFEIRAPEIIQKASTTSYHLEQPATAVVILRVGAEVVCQIVDSCSEKCDLNFARAAIVFMRAVLLYGGCFLECHLYLISRRPICRRPYLVLKSL